MTDVEAVYARHSIRSYQNRKIELDIQEKLQEKISELNAEGNLHLQFLADAGKTYNNMITKAFGLGSAPSVIACVGPESDDLEECIGYYGEKLVLYAQTLGLNTCWTGIFNKSAVQAEINPGEKLVIMIAIGYGAKGGLNRKSKKSEQVTFGNEDKPEWFNKGVELALLAPTSVNQQKFEIGYVNGEVIFRDKPAVNSKIDLGIIRCHFEIGRDSIIG